MENDGDKSGSWLKEVLQPDRLIYPVIGSAFIVFIIVSLCFGFVITEPGENYDNSVNLSRALAPFIAFMVAIVTFFTVLWRGSINQQQANEDKRKNTVADALARKEQLEKAVGNIQLGSALEQIVALGILLTIISADDEHDVILVGLVLEAVSPKAGAPLPTILKGQEVEDVADKTYDAYIEKRLELGII